MSNYELKETSIELNNLRVPSSFSYGSIELPSFPQVTIPSVGSNLLGGLSLTPEKYTRKIRYDEDVFSELPIKVFDESYNKQMALFMKRLRTELNKRLSEMGNKKVMPKFLYNFNDEDDAEMIRMSSEWDEGNAMIYFSFENNPEESNFGLIWNDNKKQNYQSRSGNLYLNNKTDIIHEAIDFVFRVY